MKKSLYHSELVKLGQIQVDVVSDVIPSKFKPGTYFVSLRVNGFDRDYLVENQNCAQALQGRKGQRVTIHAQGARDLATINVGAAEWLPAGEQQQAAPQQQAPVNLAPAGNPSPPAAQPTGAPPPSAVQPAGNPPAQQKPKNGDAQPSAGSGQKRARERTVQLLNCYLAANKAAYMGRQHILNSIGVDWSEGQVQACTSSIYIQMTRDGCHMAMPADHLIEIAPLEQPEQPEPSDNDGANVE